MTERISLCIQGMNCPEYAALLEKVVEQLPGVASVHVDFTDKTLVAEVDSDESIHCIEEAIRSLGYGVDDSRKSEPLT